MTVSNRLRAWYGAHPLHLLLMACCFALAGYAAVQLLTGRPLQVALWFIGGALLHDLVLVPLYSGADLAAQAALARHQHGSEAATPTDPTAAALPTTGFVNHVRVPVFLSLLLLLVWFPLILRRSEPYTGATGFSQDVYLGRWLLITAGVFAASALLLGARLLRRHRRTHPRHPHHRRPHHRRRPRR
ncbi:hypothetical protein [Kitasatospora mediocidica]|uniref:hypothetical protein n=1 Tax=Kitasatospora mediocidica TaxID=58352 RepID=UPI00068AEFA6|nr:hypothetical protein [Kitasatospora mediocidica]